MTAPKISVLLPTRGRLQLCAESVVSLAATASQTNDIEVILRVDMDDTSYDNGIGQALSLLSGIPMPDVHVIRGDSLGYRGLHTYYNVAAARAAGDWMLIWNDDCVMRSKGWDDDLRRFDPHDVVMVNAHGHFPVISRSWYEATGRVAASPHADSFLTMAAEIIVTKFDAAIVTYGRLGRQQSWDIHHRADELDDAGSAGRKESVLGPQGTSAQFFKPAIQDEIRRDAARVMDALQRKATGP